MTAKASVTSAEPTISMREFFALAEVRAAQETQKANPFGSVKHRAATSLILLLADRYGCEDYFA
jgi:cysteine synthase